jgi:ferritin-like metal-binding protein YciE
MATPTKRPKDVETVTKYLGDMHALEAHILQAIDKQERLLAAGHPDADATLRAIRDTLRAHLAALQARLRDLGGSPTHPVKQAVAVVAGVAAGLYDKVRTEEASKDLRDDYTALSHAVIAYTMLHTTALALGDAETARLCARHLADNARFVQGIQEAMPDLVIEEYRQDGGFALDEGASDATRRVIAASWMQPATTTGGAGLARKIVSGLLSRA